jgi:hypothetical protein
MRRLSVNGQEMLGSRVFSGQSGLFQSEGQGFAILRQAMSLV